MADPDGFWYQGGMKVLISCAAILGCALTLNAGSPDGPGLADLYRLDRLPLLKDSVKVGSVSSFDRTGGNDDGFSGKYSFVRKDPEGLVLADLQGPGVIYRVWTPTPTEDTLEFLFDGETKPRIEVRFRDLFLGKDPDFPPPLTGFGAGGYYCYVPIPFAKSCVVRMRAPKVQFYQINYAIYGADTPITSFNSSHTPEATQALVRAREFFAATGSDLSRFALPPGAKPILHQTALSLKPGSTGTVFRTTKGGRIAGLRLSPAEAIAGKARDLMLKISFDGQTAVQCPLGDFFGYAWGQPAMQSLLIGSAGGTNYCYFPMPFTRAATVEVVSERATPIELRAEVVHAAAPRTRKEAQFYALWRRENPTKTGQPFTFLDTTGRGHLVGVVLQAQGLESGKTLFFEGDDQTTLDGELAIHGTGSEDFFNGGWYDVPDRWEKRLCFPLSGCLAYEKHLGRTGAYRLFLGDAYAYRQSLKQTIEHSGQRNDIPTDYSSVTYFYSEQRPSADLAPLPLKERAVQDLTEIIFAVGEQMPLRAWSYDRATLTRKKEKIANQDVRYLSFTGAGDDWFGPHFLLFDCHLPEAGTYAIYLDAVQGPAQGKVQLFQNENPVGTPLDLYAPAPTRSGRLLLARAPFVEGNNSLMLKLVGKNENSSALGLDLVQVVCVREK
jgi:hypothetical protein